MLRLGLLLRTHRRPPHPALAGDLSGLAVRVRQRADLADELARDDAPPGVQSTAGILRIVLQPTNVLTQSGYVLASPSIDNLVIGSSSFADGVPEPATWAMMIAGFFGVGAVARRRLGALTA